MTTHTLNIEGVDRAALAEEVLSSAARVLLAAGFDISEVASLLRQAGGQLETGEAITSGDVDIEEADEFLETPDRYDLIEKFEEQPTVKRMGRLAKRSQAISDLDDAEALTKATSLVLEAFECRRESLAWLTSEATRMGLHVAPLRDEWVEEATDDELDEEDRVVFLDDYQFAGQFNWYVVSQIARSMAQFGMEDELGKFSSLALDDALALDERVRDDLRRSVEACRQFGNFGEYVDRFSGQGELAQSDFLETFVREQAFEGGTHILQLWLDAMAADGKVNRYKRSNRWKVVVR